MAHEPHFCEKSAETALKGLKYTDKDGVGQVCGI